MLLMAAFTQVVWLLLPVFNTIVGRRFTVMLPVSAALTGVVFLGERMSAMQLLAFGIALFGVVLATRTERPTQGA
jgi:threonine/homoserine efflux transporter RhtA